MTDWNSDNPAITRVLNDRWEWLDHQATGNAATKRSAWRDLGDAGAAEDRVRQSHTGRYPIELLQNAHDACADANVTASAWFEVTSSALLIANQGLPFTAKRIESLLRIGSSEKGRRKVRHHLIGYKGIGFTAVFEITDQPQVLSENVAFCFDRQEARRRVTLKLGRSDKSEPVPARYFPLPLDRESWSKDADSIRRLFDAGAVTVIRLPFRKDWTADRVMQDLRLSITAEMLLFIPAISALQVTFPKEEYGWSRVAGRKVGNARLWHLLSTGGERRSWLVRAARVPVPANEVEALRDELWKSVRNLNVAVALPWSTGPITEPTPQPIFAYFPTADRAGRGLLIHGDFYLDEARQRIAADGPQRAISNRVAQGAARLVAEIAEAVASHGNRLLACLAPVEQADGYGQYVAAQLDEALSNARIVRPADGSHPKRPTEIRRVASGLALEKERKLVEMVVVRSDLVRPGDDASRAGELLTRIKCEAIEESELAARIDPARARMEYGATLGLLEAWVRQFSYHYSVIQALQKRAVVQDITGRWRTPSEVLLRDASTPPLPSVLDRPEVLVPASTSGRQFIARLGIEAITAKTALNLLVTRLSEDVKLSPAEQSEVLSFACRLWRSEHAIFRSSDDVGVIPVPARTASGRGKVAWRRADSVYFGAAWTGKRILEPLYGPFGECEFLAKEALIETSKREREEFLRALGVTDRPRMLSISGGVNNKYWEWERLPDVASAHACPDGHPSAQRDVEASVMDRLDELLARIEAEPTFANTFVRALQLLEQPYGPEARVRCMHGAHRGAGRGNKAIGYQRWRLQESAWVPVINHPVGESLARPSEAWARMPASIEHLLLPQVPSALRDVKRLGLVDADSPSREELEQALHLLHETHPELTPDRPVVGETADWLMRRLERAVQRKNEAGDAPPLRAVSSSGSTWSTRPAIPDFPNMPNLPGVPVLPLGQWSALRKAYGLPLASELVQDEVKLGRRLSIAPLLPERQKAELVAVLLRLGAVQTVAGRLAVLREQSASSVTVTWRTGESGKAVSEERSFHLKVTRDRAGRLLKATLFRSGDLEIDNVALGRVIASYLHESDHEHTIALYLTTRQHLVEQQGVSGQDISEAQELLRRRRSPGPEEVIESANEDVEETAASVQDHSESSPAQRQSSMPQEPAILPSTSRVDLSVARDNDASDSSSAAPVETQTPPKYVDPARVRFGQLRRPERPAARAHGQHRSNRQPSTVRHAAGAPSSADLTALSANAVVEEAAMKIVERYGYVVGKALQVRDVHTENKGWDLEFELAGGRVVPVEVKGSSGTTPFVITRNEWRAARENSHYLLLHVVNVADPARAAIRIFRHLGERLSEQHMAPTSWVVHGWFELEPEEMPIERSEDTG